MSSLRRQQPHCVSHRGMQQARSVSVRPLRSQDLLALFAEGVQQSFPLRTEPLFQLLPNVRCQSGTAPGCRDRNLQCATPYHSRIDEVAVFGVVNRVAKDAPFRAGAKYSSIHATRCCSRNHQECSVDVRIGEAPLEQLDPSGARSLADVQHGTRTHDGNFGTAVRKALYFACCNFTRANDDAPLSAEINKQREVGSFVTFAVIYTTFGAGCVALQLSALSAHKFFLRTRTYRAFCAYMRACAPYQRTLAEATHRFSDSCHRDQTTAKL